MEKLITENNFNVHLKTAVADMYESKVKWEIEHFSLLTEPIKLSSADFQLIPGQNFTLEFAKDERYSDSDDDSYGELQNKASYPSLYLISKEVLPKLRIYCQTYIGDVYGETLISVNEEYSSYENQKIAMDLLACDTTEWRVLKSVENDSLLLIFHFKIYFPTSRSTVTTCSVNVKDQARSIQVVAEDLKTLYENQKHTDVVLQIDDVSINAHKAILISRSPTFLKMFDHKLQESESNVIKIEDIDAETMNQFVSLLYFPVVEADMDFNKALDLYYVADKYEVLSLRDQIRNVLLSQLSKNSCMRLLALSDRHQDIEFKAEIMKFVRLHMKSISKSEMWQEFLKSNSELAATVMSDYVQNLQI